MIWSFVTKYLMSKLGFFIGAIVLTATIGYKYFSMNRQISNLENNVTISQQIINNQKDTISIKEAEKALLRANVERANSVIDEQNAAIESMKVDISDLQKRDQEVVTKYLTVEVPTIVPIEVVKEVNVTQKVIEYKYRNKPAPKGTADCNKKLKYYEDLFELTNKRGK